MNTMMDKLNFALHVVTHLKTQHTGNLYLNLCYPGKSFAQQKGKPVFRCWVFFTVICQRIVLGVSVSWVRPGQG